MDKFLQRVFVLGALMLSACGRNAVPEPLRYAEQPAAQAVPVYVLAVHPLHNPQKLLQAYQPLIRYLNLRVPGVVFELEASRNYAAYEQKIQRREPDFLLPNPWQTLKAIPAGYRVIAMAGSEEAFRGIFLVRRDSQIRQPADLKGKTLSYPSATALAACMMPQYFLYQHGINVNKDVQNRYVGSQESAIMNVLLGETDVGVTWVLPWKMFRSEHPEQASKLKVIWETDSRQNNSVMVRTDIPEQLADHVRRLLLGLNTDPEGRRVLAAMSTDAFLPADNQRYASLQVFIDEFEQKIRKVEP